MKRGDVVQHVHYYKKFGLVIHVAPYVVTVDFEGAKTFEFVDVTKLVVTSERETALFLARRAIGVSSS